MTRRTCGQCGRPQATEWDYNTLPEGEGEGLCWREWDKSQCEGAAPSPESLQAERDRYRQALEAIRDHGKTHDQPCWAISNGDCADVMQEIARSALGV